MKDNRKRIGAGKNRHRRCELLNPDKSVSERNRQGKASLRAYMTVEASMIMPMAIGVLVICIYAAFFLYDRCVLYQEAYLVCLREGYRKDADEPAVDTEEMDETAAELIGKRVFAADTWSGTSESDGEWAVYQGTVTMIPAVFGEFFLIPDGIWKITFTASSRKTDQAWSIRSWRRKSYLIKTGIEAVISGG